MIPQEHKNSKDSWLGKLHTGGWRCKVGPGGQLCQGLVTAAARQPPTAAPWRWMTPSTGSHAAHWGQPGRGAPQGCGTRSDRSGCPRWQSHQLKTAIEGRMCAHWTPARPCITCSKRSPQSLKVQNLSVPELLRYKEGDGEDVLAPACSGQPCSLVAHTTNLPIQPSPGNQILRKLQIQDTTKARHSRLLWQQKWL